MQPVKPARVQSEINVTPLVDVVLVLLIIFMVVTPMLEPGPPVKLPTTDHPPEKPDEGARLLIAVEQDGAIWIEKEELTREQFGQALRQAAERDGDREVVIRGDARLPFGEVKRVMVAVKNAGFTRVGLITHQRGDS